MTQLNKAFILTAFIFLLFTQTTYSQSDSTIFSYKEYLTNLLKYHPIVKQADLKIKFAAAEQLAAKGNFDPVVSSSFKQKQFDDKLYYSLFKNRLQIPTRLGIDVVAGYENTKGQYFNPENKTDQFGLWNVGIEANLLQGLLVNERNVALQQAKIFQEMAQNKRQIMLNDLIFSASTAYLDWQKYHTIQKVIDESITIANTYFENTKQAFLGGEKTAIDTLEAFILLQDRTMLSQKNEMLISKAQQKLENYLWFNDVPLGLRQNTKPSTITTPIFQINTANNIKNMVDNQPIIQEKLNKQAYYEAEQRLKREKLKPKLKAKYNPLLATSDNSILPNYELSNYTWGIEFSMPILLRSERAAIQQGKIKIEETRLDIQNKQNELTNKIENTLEQQAIIQRQLALQLRNVAGYQQLLDAEHQKFLFGESSVFLLNKRQEKYINGQLKLIELQTKIQLETLNYLYFSNGLLSMNN